MGQLYFRRNGLLVPSALQGSFRRGGVSIPFGPPIDVHEHWNVFGNAMPDNPNAADAVSLSLGHAFITTSEGNITGVRFVAPTTLGSSDYIVELWNVAQTFNGLITHSQVVPVGSLTSGVWNTVALNTVKHIVPGQIYLVVLYSPEGKLVRSANVFTAPMQQPGSPLIGIQNDTDVGGIHIFNGIFIEDHDPSTFPFRVSGDAPAYYVDVDFDEGGVDPNPGNGEVSLWPGFISATAFDDGGANICTATEMYATVPGTITHVKFRASGFGLVDGAIWLLTSPSTSGVGGKVTSTVADLGPSGAWKTLELPDGGVHVNANQHFITGFRHSMGRYWYLGPVFASAEVVNGPLHAVQTGATYAYPLGSSPAINGRFRNMDNPGQFVPVNTSGGGGYAVDVLFIPD